MWNAASCSTLPTANKKCSDSLQGQQCLPACSSQQQFLQRMSSCPAQSCSKSDPGRLRTIWSWPSLEEPNGTGSGIISTLARFRLTAGRNWPEPERFRIGSGMFTGKMNIFIAMREHQWVLEDPFTVDQSDWLPSCARTEMTERMHFCGKSPAALIIMKNRSDRRRHCRVVLWQVVEATLTLSPHISLVTLH